LRDRARASAHDEPVDRGRSRGFVRRGAALLAEARGAFDVVAALIGAVAAIALFRIRVGVVPLIGACAATGLALSAVG
jgi:hypothetical protein